MPDTTIREFRTDDYAALAELHRVVHPDAPFTAEELAREDQTLPPPCRTARLVAEVDGAFAGTAWYGQNPGMYYPTVFSVQVMVAPERRRKRIGTQLHERLVGMLDALDATKRMGRIRADGTAAKAFADRHGYVETKRDIHSVLHLDGFEPESWLPRIAAVERMGIELLTLATIRSDPAKVRAYYDQFSAVRADAPRSLPATPIAFDFFVSEVVDLPEAVSEATILAFAGERCVGLTQVYRSDATPELQTGLTGVDRTYRRRGIALALKVRSLAAAKGAGAPRIRTDNDARNEGMLAVNEALGFVKRPAQITVAWDAPTGSPGRPRPAASPG